MASGGTGRWLGIDFSGNSRMWRPNCHRSNVWIADIRRDRNGLKLHDLCCVQELAGPEHPFARLKNFLASEEYDAAGIDAPFSVPARYLPEGGHAGLLKCVAEMPISDSRPFPEGRQFVECCIGAQVMDELKPLRASEAYWKGRQINVRSTLWYRARGGAAMTAACLQLMHESGNPVWPWSPRTDNKLLVEAFPAAQLREWGLPCQAYNDKSDAAVDNRSQIVEVLTGKLYIADRAPMLQSADALDAVLCSFGAIAVSENKLASEPPAASADEGWIAVHR